MFNLNKAPTMKLRLILLGLAILFASLIGCQQTEKITTKIDTVKLITTKYDTVVLSKKDTVVIVNNDTIYISNPSNGTSNVAFGFKTSFTGTAKDGTAFSDSVNYIWDSGDGYATNYIGNQNTSPPYYNLELTSHPLYIDLKLNISNLGTADQSVSWCEISLYLPMGDKLIYVNANGSNNDMWPYTISNINYNTTNALLTYDFVANFDGTINSTGNPLTLTGKFANYVYTQVIEN
jgi:hypothetical protein